MDTTTRQLRGQVAGLESRVDLLESELTDLNAMLVSCGFPEGIKTLKETVIELLEEEDSSSFNQECS